MQPGTTPRGRERGQILVIFALGIIAVIAMTGLVIDGGGTYVQRRGQQNVVDAASMAGAYAYLNSNGDVNQAQAAAQQVAADNGYQNGTNGSVVTVSVTGTDPETASVVVTLTKPHRNYFSGIVGFTTWDVTTTATAGTGVPNGANGVMPIIFNKDAFDNNKGDEQNPVTFDEPGTGTQDVPQPADPPQFNWTDFCTANGNPCNGDSNTIDQIINDNGKKQTVTLNMEIGPLNAGAHTTLFSDLAKHIGNAYPVAIVDNDGKMLGWAWFHLTGSNGGSEKQISGWFSPTFNEPPLVIIPGGGTGSSEFGGYRVYLTN
jgi:Flp pilus assembly protein TadG